MNKVISSLDGSCVSIPLVFSAADDGLYPEIVGDPALVFALYSSAINMCLLIRIATINF